MSDTKVPEVQIISGGSDLDTQILIHGEPLGGVTRVDISPIVCDRLVSVSLEMDVLDLEVQRVELDICPKHLLIPEDQLRTLARLNGFDLVKRDEDGDSS